MTDAELRDELEFLGIDEANYELVALLPLVQVAWADGDVQRDEAELIIAAAKRRGLLDDNGVMVLKGWLNRRPSGFYIQRARRLLSELVNRHRGLGKDVDLGTLQEVVAFCDGVAQSAGGFFGIGKVHRDEIAAIEEIATALGVRRDLSWEDVKERLA